MQQHWNKAHIGEFAIMLDTCAPYGCHEVATKETERGLWVVSEKGTHEVTRMQVATGFTGNEIVVNNKSVTSWEKAS